MPRSAPRQRFVASRLLDAHSLKEAILIATAGRPATQEVRFSPDSRLLGRLLTGPRQLAIHEVAVQARR